MAITKLRDVAQTAANPQVVALTGKTDGRDLWMFFALPATPSAVPAGWVEHASELLGGGDYYVKLWRLPAAANTAGVTSVSIALNGAASFTGCLWEDTENWDSGVSVYYLNGGNTPNTATPALWGTNLHTFTSRTQAFAFFLFDDIVSGSQTAWDLVSYDQGYTELSDSGWAPGASSNRVWIARISPGSMSANGVTATSTGARPAVFGGNAGMFAFSTLGVVPPATGPVVRRAPQYHGAGTIAVSADTVANPTNLVPGLPAVRPLGGTLLAFTTSRSISATVATPAGWALLPGFPVQSATASGGRIYVFAKTIVGNETAPTLAWTGVTTGTTGDSSQAVIHCWSAQEGAPTLDGSVGTTNAAITTTIAVPALTTAQDNSLQLAVWLKVNDTAHTWTPPSGWTERTDQHTTTGTGHSISVAEIVRPTAAANAATTAAPSTTVSSRGLLATFALTGEPITTPLAMQTYQGAF